MVLGSMTLIRVMLLRILTATLSVVRGLSLGSMDNLKFDVGDGTKDTTMAFQGSLNNKCGIKAINIPWRFRLNFEQAFEALTLHITDTGIDGMKVPNTQRHCCDPYQS